MFSLIQDLNIVHHTKEEHIDEAKSGSISLALSVGSNKLSIYKPLNSLLTKFLRTDGLNHNHATRPSGDGSTNPSTDSQCARIDQTK